MRRFIQILMLFIVAVSSGSHLAALQAVAWVGMFVDHVQDASFAEALSATFDGEQPCRLCEVIAVAAEKRAGDKAPAQQPDGQEIGWHLLRAEGGVSLVAPPAARLGVLSVCETPSPRASRPPLPPPWVI